MGAGTDIECPVASRLDAGLTKGFDQADEPQAGAEALLRVGAIGEDLFAQQRRAWPDRFGLARYPLDGPVGEPPVRQRHMLGDRCMPAIARPAHVRGDALALVEQLDRPHRDLGLNRLDRLVDARRDRRQRLGGSRPVDLERRPLPGQHVDLGDARHQRL